MERENEQGGATVLVVDDAPQNVKLLRLILKNAGYKVTEASSGPEALTALEEEQPDAMILDVRMPGMTGFEVCERLRSDPRYLTLPVIMVTALSAPEQRIQGIKAGATDFISKPFDKRELLARLEASLLTSGRQSRVIIPELPGIAVILSPQWRLIGLSPEAFEIFRNAEPRPEAGAGMADIFASAAAAQAMEEGEFPLRLPWETGEFAGEHIPITRRGGRLYARMILLSRK